MILGEEVFISLFLFYRENRIPYALLFIGILSTAKAKECPECYESYEPGLTRFSLETRDILLSFRTVHIQIPRYPFYDRSIRLSSDIQEGGTILLLCRRCEAVCSEKLELN